jgi:hypothetical protein
MLDVLLCHSADDRETAAAVAARLERGAETKVWLKECGPVTEVWDAGLSSAAILLLLSPETVPARSDRSTWESVLEHNGEPPVGCVLVRPCRYPLLLERKHFFRWSDAPLAVLREIERWILSLHPQPAQPSFLPARLPWFEGRDREMEWLWALLADRSGTAVLLNEAQGSGKSSLAQEFARVASDHFRDIIWVECGKRSSVSIAGEIAAAAGLRVEGGPEQLYARVAEVLAEHRLLVVLDDLLGDPPAATVEGGRASVLITARSAEIPFPEYAEILRIDAVASKGPAGLPEDPDEVKLLDAVAACRPQGFPLGLAARIAGLGDSEARAASERLARQRWIDPVETASLRFRCGRRQPAGEAQGRRLTALLDVFSKWRTQPELCRYCVAESEAAFECALASEWDRAVELADRLFAFLTDQGRWMEAAQLFEQLRAAARERQDWRVVENCARELGWLLDHEGATRRPPVPGEQLPLVFS